MDPASPPGEAPSAWRPDAAASAAAPRTLAAPTRGLRRATKVGAILVGTGLLALTGGLAIGAQPAGRWWLPLVTLLGLALADFISGLVHWAADTFGSARTPVFGNFVSTFRVHHLDPEDITRHDPIEANADVFLFSAPVHLGLLLFVRDAFVLWLLFGLFLASYPNSQIHKWAHLQQRPRWVTRLQQLRLLLSPHRHAHHHSGTHTTDYCITTGWLNPLLDATRFFRGLEWLLARFGVEPTR
jgi:hypothetical protein